MTQNFTRFLSAGVVLLLPLAAAAQTTFSPAHSNYAGLGGAIWNPATLADNRYTLELRLLGVDAHATNNAYRYIGPWTPRNTEASLDLSKQYLSLRAGSDSRMGSAGLSVFGPGLLFRLNARNTVAVSTRVRVAFQANELSPEFIQNAVDGFKQRATVRNQTLSLNMNAMSEWNVSYGRVVMDTKKHFLKAGVTVRRLSGLGSAYLQLSELDYEVLERTAATGDSTLRLNRLAGGFGYSNPDAFEDVDVDQALKWLKPGSGPGSGWGLDVGVSYEFRPNTDKFYYIDKKGREKMDHSRNKYLVRVSAALTDMGSVQYASEAANYANINATNLKVSEADVEGIDGGNFDERINRILGTVRYDKKTSLTTKLPTALHLDVDYHLLSKLYVNAAINHGMTSAYAVGMRTFSTATLSPRFETKWVEIAPSFAMINNYHTFAPGLSLRVGPLLVGSNDLSAFFASSDPYGANAYVQLSLLNIGNTSHKLKKKVKGTKAAPVAPATQATPPAQPLQTTTPASKDANTQPTTPEVTAPEQSAAPTTPEPTTPAVEPVPAEPATTPAPAEATPAETTTAPTPAPAPAEPTATPY